MMSFQNPEPRLILASASSARQALLTNAELKFEVQAAAIDEAEIKRSAKIEAMSADDTALLLADLKAQRIARRHPEALVIGCDQLLVCDGHWYDKPTDIDDARAQLLSLRGKKHTLVTTVICQRAHQRLWHHISRPKLQMREFSDAFLTAYLHAEAEALMSTVGAYRLEGLGVQLFDTIDGDHSAILGLPLLPLLGFLRQHGVLIR